MVNAVVMKNIYKFGVYVGVPMERKEKMKKIADNNQNMIRGGHRIGSCILSEKKRYVA